MRAPVRPALLAAYALLVLLPGFLVAGCADRPPADDPEAVAEFKEINDPMEPTNRVFYAVNNGIDRVILRPLAVAYRWAFPEAVRTGVHNVLSNIASPVLLVGDMLQAKPRRAGDTLMRFLVNTTAGVGGVFDVATGWGWPSHDSDAGMTLAVWGLPEGPFLFLPVLGPSSPRDATGFAADLATDPFLWAGSGLTVSALGWSRTGLGAVDQRTNVLDSLDKVQEQALDPYATLRSLYRQHRESQIEDIRADNRTTVPAWFVQPASPSAGEASSIGASSPQASSTQASSGRP